MTGKQNSCRTPLCLKPVSNDTTDKHRKRGRGRMAAKHYAAAVLARRRVFIWRHQNAVYAAASPTLAQQAWALNQASGGDQIRSIKRCGVATVSCCSFNAAHYSARQSLRPPRTSRRRFEEHWRTRQNSMRRAPRCLRNVQATLWRRTGRDAIVIYSAITPIHLRLLSIFSASSWWPTAEHSITHATRHHKLCLSIGCSSLCHPPVIHLATQHLDDGRWFSLTVLWLRSICVP